MQTQAGELHQRIWAVVTDKTVEATSQTYDEARRIAEYIMRETKNGGVCVATNEAARCLITKQ